MKINLATSKELHQQALAEARLEQEKALAKQKAMAILARANSIQACVDKLIAARAEAKKLSRVYDKAIDSLKEHLDENGNIKDYPKYFKTWKDLNLAKFGHLPHPTEVEDLFEEE